MHKIIIHVTLRKMHKLSWMSSGIFVLSTVMNLTQNNEQLI